MKKIIPLSAVVLILLISLASCIQINRSSASEESNRRIQPYRELTEREQLLAERIEDTVLEMNMIQDCEVAVMLDEPIHVIVSIILEINVKLSEFTDLDIQAVKTIVSDTSMSSENVTILAEDISIGVGESE